MPPQRTPIYLYVQTPKLGASLAKLLLKKGYEPILLDHRLGVDPRKHVVLIETRDDVAHMCQVVHYFYTTYKVDSPLPLIAFLSEKALKKNPMARYWLIDGHSAIANVLPRKKRRLGKAARRGLLWFLPHLLPLYKDG